jgi:ankyrin repeat protein
VSCGAISLQEYLLILQHNRSVKDAGYPVSTHFSKSPSSPDSFVSTQEKQDRAYQILGRASVEPSYVDPDTGDNVLHALARLKLPERGSLLSKIQAFVSEDIDLNLHNKDRDCPLAAFIRERPFQGVENDETGATMSKYLDALLWKDPRRRVPNKINVNLRNHDGATALYYAATRARPDSVRSLIEAGANVNARLGRQLFPSLPPGHLAHTQMLTCCRC